MRGLRLLLWMYPRVETLLIDSTTVRGSVSKTGICEVVLRHIDVQRRGMLTREAQGYHRHGARQSGIQILDDEAFPVSRISVVPKDLKESRQ